jgi:hypothetical protein
VNAFNAFPSVHDSSATSTSLATQPPDFEVRSLSGGDHRPSGTPRMRGGIHQRHCEPTVGTLALALPQLLLRQGAVKILWASPSRHTRIRISDSPFVRLADGFRSFGWHRTEDGRAGKSSDFACQACLGTHGSGRDSNIAALTEATQPYPSRKASTCRAPSGSRSPAPPRRLRQICVWCREPHCGALEHSGSRHR